MSSVEVHISMEDNPSLGGDSVEESIEEDGFEDYVDDDFSNETIEQEIRRAEDEQWIVMTLMELQNIDETLVKARMRDLICRPLQSVLLWCLQIPSYILHMCQALIPRLRLPFNLLLLSCWALIPRIMLSHLKLHTITLHRYGLLGVLLYLSSCT